MILKLQFGDDLRRIVVENPSLSDVRALCVKSFNVRDFLLKYIDPEGDKVSITEEEDLREALRLSSSAPLRVLVISKESNPSPSNSQPEPSRPETSGVNQLSDLFSKLGISGVAPNLPTLARQLSEFLPQEDIAKLPLFLQQLLSGFQSAEGPSAQASPSSCGPASCAPSGPLHPNVICDGCEGPVIGVRYKCKTCPDFDFCQECNARKTHPHPFQPIESPLGSDARPVHAGVSCDGCHASPIMGTRFKCTVCWNFDLCESCEAAGVHPPEHPRLKISRPVQGHGHAQGQGFGPCRGRGGFRRFARAQCRPVPVRLGATYLEDVTIPDGSILVAGTKFLKVWKMKNEGEAWPNGCKLVFLGGDNLSAQDAVPVEAAVSGAEVNVAVEMTAPAQPGRYSSYWRLEDPDGNRFGQRIWVDLFVAASQDPSPAPTPVPAPAPVHVPIPEPSAPVAPQWTPEQQSAIQTLQGMGYPLDVIEHAFEAANGDVSVVLQALLL